MTHSPVPELAEGFPTPLALNVHQQGSGFPILCLHGHPGSGSSMSVFTRSLGKQFWTIAPDLRGYGSSRTNQPFQMQDHLIDLEALLDQLKIDECLVLGWSLGGILAMELALKLPEQVRGLILVATAANPRGNHPPISWEDNLYTGIASVLNRIHPGWKWNIDTFGRRSLYRYLIQQHTPAAYQYLADEALLAYLQTSSAATRALNEALRQGYNRLPTLTQIQCPCLVMAGEADRHITASSSRETSERLTDSRWQLYPDVAHLFPWEIPDQVVKDIQIWLKDSFPELLS